MKNTIKCTAVIKYLVITKKLAAIKRIALINVITVVGLLVSACGGGSAGPSIPLGGSSSAVFSSAASSVSGPSQPVVAYRVHIAVEGEGEVTFGGGNVCQGECIYQLAGGASFTFRGVPADGFTFARWQGSCSGNAACTLVLNQAVTLTAIFEPKVVAPTMVSLLLNVDGEGQI